VLLLVVLRWSHFAIWMTWLIYWSLSARGVKVAAREESRWQRMAHFGPMIVASILIAMRNPPGPLDGHVLPPSLILFFIGTVLLIVGLSFSVWARVVLGRNWSGTVTIKKDHELIQSGPYRWVRHPIYTGIILGFLGSAVARNSPAGYLGVALVAVGFWFKLQREETWLRETFGDSYAQYADKTARLIPFLL
jgi:protein-S-isoprenylcysteine O-methyltransferase Ste14